MEQGYFKKLSNVLWTGLVAGVVLLAVYVSLGRYLMSIVGAYQEEILAELNQRLPFTVEAREVRGEWHGFTPELVMGGLRLRFAGGEEAAVELNEGRLAVDAFGSLRTRSLRGKRLELQRLSLQGEISDDGRFRITGLGGGGGNFVPWMESFLASIEQVVLVDNTLRVALPGNERRTLDLNLKLQREGRRRIVQATMATTAGTQITAIADGLGNPFDSRTYTGDLHLDIALSSLESVRDLLPSPMLDWRVDGSLDLEAWIRWQEGDPTLEVQMAADDLLVTSPEGDAPVPIDHLSLQASLLDSRNRWTVYASDLILRAGGQELALPRLQLDSWGDTLRLRASDADIDRLNAMAIALGPLPQNLKDVFTILQPAGRLPVLQFHLEDYREPGQGWTLEARFEDLSVQSWKAAPGVNAARGYLKLEPGGGEVLLDSYLFALSFPTLYAEPLFYDDFYGAIDLAWSGEGLKLSSEQFIARGVEGTARAIFGLAVPFQKTEVGIEMDLLVGLEDSHPIHRTKYIPRTLNRTLVDWLRGSLGEGKVEEGAFLWRGSLGRAAADHRSIQLFFNVADTNLNYHAQWPQVSDLDGMVLIDDTNVSVWAEHARLYGSEVNFLSAEAWLSRDREMQLAIDAAVVGGASDGLEVVNSSPLNGLLGGAFSRWDLSGSLETGIQLQLNLNRMSDFPQVEVVTRWRDVDALIRPTDLSVTDLNGELTYSSVRGLHSSGMRGQLWGEELRVEVAQLPPDDAGPTASAVAEAAPRYDPKSSAVQVHLHSEIDMQSVRDWLDLEQLAFARGRSPVIAEVLVEPGSVPRLSATTDLSGVALDLPSPYGKRADETMNLQMNLPLGAEQTLIDFTAPEPGIYFAMDATGGTVRGATLGFGDGPFAVADNTLVLTGHAALVDEPAWSDFYERYIALTPRSELDTAADPNAPADPNDPVPQEPQLALQIDKLRADQLLIWGQQVTDVTLSLEHAGGSSDWQVTAENPWLEGELTLAHDFGQGSLRLNRLDLAGLDTLDGAGQDAGNPAPAAELEADGEGVRAESEAWVPLELPELSVSILDLRNDELDLGTLTFELNSDAELITARNILGELAGTRISEDRPGEYVWRQSPEGGSSSLQVALRGDDFGDVFTRLNYQRTLESDSGEFSVDWRWPGGPQDFALAQTSGAASLDLQRGRFLDAPQGASGTLRVVSLLNFAGIVQRLSLTHMFEAGIPFDSVIGEMQLDAGTMEVDPIEVKGASSGFRFNGLVELAEQDFAPSPEGDVPDASAPAGHQVSGELVVTLPVANNLPWVAALAAGLPVAAGVFVVSKVFEKQVNRVSSGVYKVSGALDEPDIEFDRIFDTGVQAVGVDPNMPPADANSPGESTTPAS